MPRRACLLFAVLLSFLAPRAALARQTDSTDSSTVAVADFSGTDRELGRFLADTLLTDLAHSQQLRLVERAELRQALAELKLQSTGLVEAPAVKRLGKVVGASRLIVGNFLVRGGSLTANARVMDVETGRVLAGGAASASGPASAPLEMVHSLARAIAHRLTGEDLDLGAQEDPAPFRQDAPEPQREAIRDAGVSEDPDPQVTQAALERTARSCAIPGCLLEVIPMAVTAPNAPVTRLRALAAVVKALVRPEEMSEFSRRQHPLPPDARTLPRWACAYVACAVQRGLLAPDADLRATEPATESFLAALMGRRLSVRARLTHYATDQGGARFTGLVIDARGLPLERAMSVRILDTRGRVLYPWAHHIPGDDFLQSQGMVDYLHEGSESARAGSRPLVVQASDVASYGSEDVVVDDDAARSILNGERTSGFLARWKVVVLLDQGR